MQIQYEPLECWQSAGSWSGFALGFMTGGWIGAIAGAFIGLFAGDAAVKLWNLKKPASKG